MRPLTALSALVSATEQGGGDAKGSTVSVFGHAVFLNAIAYKVAQAAGASDDAKAALLDMDLGETEGIRIDLTGGDVAKYPLAS